jgi:hypothetical protein
MPKLDLVTSAESTAMLIPMAAKLELVDWLPASEAEAQKQKIAQLVKPAVLALHG